ncbi:chaperone protein HscA [Streptomyces sp. NBRC 110611]|nr:chaperone protein HscA [Streptomyces sp. NBRC 110611]
MVKHYTVWVIVALLTVTCPGVRPLAETRRLTVAVNLYAEDPRQEEAGTRSGSGPARPGPSIMSKSPMSRGASVVAGTTSEFL